MVRPACHFLPNELGVIHIVPTLLLPENFTLLDSTEKVLLSVNATRFVSLMRSANLSSTYIGGQGEDQAWTFLAPADSVLDVMDDLSDRARRLALATLPLGSQARASASIREPVAENSPMAALLQYHILPGRLAPADIRDGMLVSTELRTPSLGGRRQRVAVEVSDRIQVDNIGTGEIRFGGAATLGVPGKQSSAMLHQADWLTKQ
jgi:hypothetical protein